MRSASDLSIEPQTSQGTQTSNFKITQYILTKTIIIKKMRSVSDVSNEPQTSQGPQTSNFKKT